MDTQIWALAEEQAAYCQVFSNPKRILILWVLAEGEMSVSEIASAIGASLQNTSQHLRLMKDRFILSSRRDGQVIYYHIESGDCLINKYPISVQMLHKEHTKT